MTSPSVSAVETTGPWQGSLSGTGLPASSDDGAVIIASEQAEGATGILVSYADGQFTSRFWSAGPPVPLFIEILSPASVKAIRDQVAHQLQVPGSGLDDIPLRDFVETARLYLEAETSDRFTEAVFGSITQVTPGEVQGQVNWPGDVVGTVLSNGSAQTHLAHLPAADPAPLRQADLRSLVSALQQALANPGLDPLWQQVLTGAQQALQ